MRLRKQNPELSIRCPEGTSSVGRDLARQVLDGMARDFDKRLASSAKPIDPMCLEEACKQTIRQIYYEVATSADQFDVPGDVLWHALVHRIVSDHMGWNRGPRTSIFLEEEPQRAKEKPPRGTKIA